MQTAPVPQRSLPELASLAAATAVVGGAGAVAYSWDPTGTSAFTPKCILHELTGLWCPGCGVTRSVHSLLHGDIASAFTYNPLFFVVLPFFVWLGVRYAAGVVWPDKRLNFDVNLSPRIAFGIAGVIIGFAVLRNLPIEPFSWLAPHAA